jgi:hypothetical protein
MQVWRELSSEAALKQLGGGLIAKGFDHARNDNAGRYYLQASLWRQLRLLR